jgi:hypothetical protein
MWKRISRIHDATWWQKLALDGLTRAGYKLLYLCTIVVVFVKKNALAFNRERSIDN